MRKGDHVDALVAEYQRHIAACEEFAREFDVNADAVGLGDVTSQEGVGLGSERARKARSAKAWKRVRPCVPHALERRAGGPVEQGRTVAWLAQEFHRLGIPTKVCRNRLKICAKHHSKPISPQKLDEAIRWGYRGDRKPYRCTHRIPQRFCVGTDYCHWYANAPWLKPAPSAAIAERAITALKRGPAVTPKEMCYIHALEWLRLERYPKLPRNAPICASVRQVRLACREVFGIGMDNRTQKRCMQSLAHKQAIHILRAGHTRAIDGKRAPGCCISLCPRTEHSLWRSYPSFDRVYSYIAFSFPPVGRTGHPGDTRCAITALARLLRKPADAATPQTTRTKAVGLHLAPADRPRTNRPTMMPRLTTRTASVRSR